MSQPTPYTRQADFTDWSEEHPGEPHQGVSMDAEFNAVAVTLAGMLANLLLIQRDDGALRNGSVGLSTLSSGVLALINTQTGIVAGAWATAITYVAGQNWVSEGTGTYVCATSHTSGDFAADLAAGKWLLIYDTAGATPADGSVTTEKLADGAVTLAKLALTALDLSGTIRAAGGLSAGTAGIGEILAAKKATGDVLGKIERATRAQGQVGWRIGGGTGGVNWDVRQDTDSDTLELYDGTAVRVSFRSQQYDFGGYVRATGFAAPLSGSGIGLGWSAGEGYIDSFDHTAAQWRPANLRASVVRIYCGNVLVATGTSDGVNFPQEASVGSYAIGYRDTPQNAQNGAYTLALSDRGKHIYSKNVGAQAISVPANSSVALPIGATIPIVNRGSSPITVAPAGGVTLRLAGTTSDGDRTIAINGVGTLLKVETDLWFISGAGVS